MWPHNRDAQVQYRRVHVGTSIKRTVSSFRSANGLINTSIKPPLVGRRRLGTLTAVCGRPAVWGAPGEGEGRHHGASTKARGVRCQTADVVNSSYTSNRRPQVTRETADTCLFDLAAPTPPPRRTSPVPGAAGAASGVDFVAVPVTRNKTPEPPGTGVQLRPARDLRRAVSARRQTGRLTGR